MQESYRLLKESLWFLEALEDPDYSAHQLRQQQRRLRQQLEHHVTALEADLEWSSKGDDSIFLLPKVPEGWTPRILEPTRELRFTAASPTHEGHRIVVMANDPEVLSHYSHEYANGNIEAEAKIAEEAQEEQHS